MDWEAFYNNFRAADFIPGYEIQNRLGGGAFGDVYKARKQSIGKAYAIKFLKIEDDGQRQAVERELTQVRHFAVIDHPNLVTIEDLGTVMGVPYLIMGYAGEDTLARRLKSGTLDAEQALLYFVQAARGALALHDRRLVHFDLKPSNIFLKGDVARVGDYGLSKLLTDGRTTLSYGRGTPQYMAPEMLKNRADHRADIYSLGVILFESLAGDLPFRGDQGTGLVLRETDDPPPFPEDFPHNLRGVVERCLRLSPDDRFVNVGEMLDDIGQSARQGDSVCFDWSERSPDPYRPHGGASQKAMGVDAPTPEPRPTPSSTNEELRQTAAELARGAVEVARGVWDGLRNAPPRDPSSPNVPAGESSSSPDAGPVVQPPSPGTAGPASPQASADAAATGWRAELERKRSGTDAAGGGPAPTSSASAEGPTAVQGLFAAEGLEGSGENEAGSRANIGPDGKPIMAAIPVPPRVEGGVLGTVFSTIVLSLEVLVSLVGNLLAGTARVMRGGWERFGRTSGGIVRRTVRFTFFLTVMGVLGFTLMTIGMFLIEAMGGA